MYRRRADCGVHKKTGGSMRKTIFSFVWVISALSIATGARAESQAVYVGLGAGISNASFNSADFNLGLPQVAESADTKSTGLKIFGGVRLNKNVSLELGYVDLGKFNYNYDGGGAGSVRIDYQVSGLSFSAIGSLPLSEDFSLFGRLGLFASTAKFTVASASGSVGATLAANGVGVGTSDTATATSLYFGAGAQYDFTQRISARVEYENFGEVGDSTNTGRATVSLISASLLFRF
jgi:OmpA-OmpF porin, OOP family